MRDRPECSKGGVMKKILKTLTAAMTAFILAAGTAAAPAAAAGMGGDPGGGFGGSSSGAPESYTAVVEYTETQTVSGATIESYGQDENAVLVATDDIVVTLEDMTVYRENGSSTGGDDASFYGVGASVLVTAGTLIIDDSSIYGNAAGAAGVFAYGDGTAYVSDTEIETVKDTSGGIHVAGGGTFYAWDLTVVTAGGSSAAIRSDRGGGTMVVDGGTYTSKGTGSPAIYSAGDITVNNATLTATASEAICMEGLNAIRLYDCDLSGSMADDSQNDCTWNIILYQSQSGDAEEGNAYFEMVGGSITAENGGMFYTTNTESTYVISGVDITYAPDSEFVIKCTGNSNARGWGSTGSNGANCTFTAIDQELEGAVIWDSISTLDLYLTEGSVLTGYAEDDESNAGSGGGGYANVVIDETSTWIVTADSTVTSLSVSGTITDAYGNSVSVVGTDGTVYVSGTSEYTITVESYSETADTSGASSVHSFSEYSVEEPESSQDSDGSEDGSSGGGSTGGETYEETIETVITELYGSDRYETMKAIAEEAFLETGSTYAVIATGENYPDALAAASLAGVLDAPVILVNENKISVALETLEELNVESVYIVGGAASVSENIAAQIEEAGILTERIAGDTRQETALKIAEKVKELSAENPSDTCLIAAGGSFPDALSGSPYSYWSGSPIYLAENDGSVSEAVMAAIEEGGYSRVIILGGEASISAEAYAELENISGVTVTRLGGETRYETSVYIAVWSVAQGMSYDGLAVAAGANYPDALCGAALCGQKGSVLLLANATAANSTDLTEVLASQAETLSGIYILGGTSSVSAEVREEISSILN